MFGFNVLAWNAGYQEGSYSKSINRSLFGGSPGHTSAELVIPVSEENKQLIDEVNKNNKLVIQETTTLISKPIATAPFYETLSVPCYKIYFSFWGDVNTKKTVEQHRLLDPTRDRIEEGKGIPRQNSAKGQQIFGDTPMEWHGRIGSTKGSPGIEYIQHRSALTPEQIRLSDEKIERLKAIEKDKELLLWHVKEIAEALGALSTEQQKQAYRESAKVQDIFETHGVRTIEELSLKLASRSAAMNHLRQELSDLSVRFGASPDEIVSFPLDPQHDLEYSLDYRAMLREMGRIANSVVPYHALKMNCCTATMNIINAGINSAVREKLHESGYKLPVSNFFFETPQSVFDFSLTLARLLANANAHVEHQDLRVGVIARFAALMHDFFVRMMASIFQPSEKQQLFNLRAEYVEYLLNAKAGLKQLAKEFSAGRIEQNSYKQLNDNAIDLIDFYKNKIIDVEGKLLTGGYITRTTDYQSQIKHVLDTRLWAQSDVIAKLESNDQIMEAINKMATHIYTNLQWQEIYGVIFYKDIVKIVAHHVEQIVNDHRIPMENFDYLSANGIKRATTMATQIQRVLDKESLPKKTTVPRDVARLFLTAYEANLENLTRKVAFFEKNVQKQQGLESLRAQKMRQSLLDTQASMLEQKEAIEKINSGLGEEIDIIFPPRANIQELSLEQLNAFLALLSARPELKGGTGSVVAEQYRNIKLLTMLQKRLLETVSDIKPGYYDFYAFDKIRASLPRGSFATQSAELMLETLAQNLIDNLDKLTVKLPLSFDARNALISYLNFKQYIKESGWKLSNSTKLGEILLSYDEAQLRQVLDDNDRIMRFTQKDNRSSQPSLISEHLTRQEHRFIYLFDKIVTRKQVGSHQEKLELSMLIEQNLGNMALNGRLGLFEKDKHSLVERYQMTITDVKYFMFKTQLSRLNDVLLEKAEKALQKIENDESLDLKSKLTLYQLGRLNDLAKLKSTLADFDALGLTDSSSKLKKLHLQATRSAELIEKIEQHMAEEQLFECGDLVMNHSKKSLALKNKSANREVALTHTFISKYGHAAQVYFDPETNAPTFSHIWGEYQTDVVRVADIAISDIFRVDVTRLVVPAMQIKLEAYYSNQGLDYKEEIEKLYQENMQRLLVESKERFEGVKNDKAARFKAGWADYGFYGGHHEATVADRRDVHGVMYGKGEHKIKDKMICSEFVANSVVAAIYETNDALQQQMRDAGFEVSTDENIISIPLKKERLSRVHPQRLINLLHAEGCLVQVNQSSFIKKLINQQNPYEKVEVNVIKTPGVLFYEQLLALVKQTPDKAVFICKAIEACETYAAKEQLGIQITSPKMQAFLHKNFAIVHEQIQSDPHCVIKFLRNLAHFLGFKPTAQKILNQTVAELEKIQHEVILDNYKVAKESPRMQFTLYKKQPRAIITEDNNENLGRTESAEKPAL